VCDLLLVIVAGLFGGLGTNYLVKPNEGENRHPILHDLLLGTIAAFSVPLFLYFADSRMLPATSDGLSLCTVVAHDANRWVFFGICLLAALFSRRFLTTMGDRILKQVEEAKTEAKKATSEAAEAKLKSEAAGEKAAKAGEETAHATSALMANSDALGAILEHITSTTSAPVPPATDAGNPYSATELKDFIAKNNIKLFNPEKLLKEVGRSTGSDLMDEALQELLRNGTYRQLNIKGKDYFIQATPDI